MASIWSNLSPSAQPELDCVIYPIEDQSVLSVKGPDSQKFMQGQFTCNLSEINSQSYRPGACCNAKGRMVSSFNLLQVGEGDYLLSLHHSITESTQSHLKKYMVFFKSKMLPVDYVLAGITGADADSAIKCIFPGAPSQDFDQVTFNGLAVIKLPHGAGYQLYIPTDQAQAQATLELLLSKCTLSNNTLWNENLIRHGIGSVEEKTQEAFIPQMMNLSQQGGISFNKGCYTGQEIVARMQYLGKLKRHMYRLGLQADVTLSAGDEVFSQDKPVGTVVNTVIHQQQQQALVVLEDKALPSLAEGGLTIGENRAIAKELLSLPYDVIDAQPE